MGAMLLICAESPEIASSRQELPLFKLNHCSSKSSFGDTGNADFDCNPLLLWSESCSIFVLEDEGASRLDSVSIEDTFIRLARNRAGLATLSVDETNDRAGPHRPSRPGRPCRPRWSL